MKALPTITIADASATESGTVSFTVELNQNAIAEVSFTVNTLTGGTDGTATTGQDFTPIANQTFSIPVGTSQMTVSVATVDDDVYEGRETFTLELSSPTNAVFSGGALTLRTTGAIKDDETAGLTVDTDPVASGVQTGVDGFDDVANVAVTVDVADDKTKLPTPSNFRAAASDTTVKVSWDAVTNSAPEGYGVSYACSNDSTRTRDVAETDTSTTFTGLTNGVQCRYLMWATGNNQDGCTVTGDDTATLTHSLVQSADADYRGLADLDAAVAVSDDETLPDRIVLTIDPASVNEGDSATGIVFTARLETAATPANTGTLAGSQPDYSTTPSILTVRIHAGMVSSGGTDSIVVTPVQDSDSEPIETIVFHVASPPARLTVGPVTLNLVDDDEPSVSLVLDDTSIAESGGTTTLRTTISRAVNAATTITVPANPSSSVQLSGATLTIPTNQQNSSGSGITITAVNNEVDTAPNAGAPVAIRGTLTATGIMPPADVTLTITDDDARGVTVSENGGTASYTVRLNSQPTGPIAVMPQSFDTNVVTVSGALTFTAGNYNQPQIVTVTGVNDNVDNTDGRGTFAISHIVAGGDYDVVAAASVSVNVNDDDATPTRIILTVNLASVVENADAASVTITASFPTGNASRQLDTEVTVSRTGGANWTNS